MDIQVVNFALEFLEVYLVLQLFKFKASFVQVLELFVILVRLDSLFVGSMFLLAWDVRLRV